MTGHCRRGRLTTKGIGSSNKGNRIDYDNLNKFATIQPENLSPSTEAPAVTQSKDVIKNQNNNNNNTIDKEDKKKMNSRKILMLRQQLRIKIYLLLQGIKYSKELKRITKNLKKHIPSSFRLGSMDLRKASSLKLKLRIVHDLGTKLMLNLIQPEQLF
jgi:hypothetical protein